jgi:hypothetical protein
MARTSCSLKQASGDVGHPLDPDEAERTFRRRDFQDILRSEKNKFFAGIANDPTRSKSVAIGKMEMLIDRLIVAGEYEKAANAIDKLGKLEGWVGADSNVNIFSGLTARDIAEARARLAGNAGANSRGMGNTLSGLVKSATGRTATGQTTEVVLPPQETVSQGSA